VDRAIEFVKMSGTGNDFVMIDNRGGPIAEGRKAAAARHLCDRRRSVGGDGLVLLERADGPAAADVRMRIFNADGSEAEMCGNGSRCLAMFARERGAAGERMSIQTMAGVISAAVDGASVRVELTRPAPIADRGALEFAGQTRRVWFTNTGVPHAVVFVEDLEIVDVRAWGSALRFHAAFGQAGTNANFVRVTGRGRIAVRTYERGVEDETLACGTGSTASALVAASLEGWASPVSVAVQSGEELTIHFRGRAPQYDGASLEGTVSVSFRGVVEFDRG
jgi:diaminopimelate epimerase